VTLGEFEAAAFSLLGRAAAMTLATCSDGLPWAADVYFAPVGYAMYFFSSPRSRHCRNLEVNPACAATVHPEASSWKDIRGLQMEGLARRTTALETAAALPAYLGKFPFAAELLKDPPATAGKLANVRMHVFRPSAVRWLDNSSGFGTRFLLRLEDGRPVGEPLPEERA
jgi:hypothetical protein